MVERLLASLEMLSALGRQQGSGSLQGFRFGSFAELLLAHGRLWWEQLDLDRAGAPRGLERRCWQNSAELADHDPDLVYVEGFAVCSALPVAIEHAWCVSKKGDGPGAIDSTWPPDREVAYVGLPLSDEVRSLARKRVNRWQLLASHNPFGRALLQDGPDPEALVDLGVPVRAFRTSWPLPREVSSSRPDMQAIPSLSHQNEQSTR